MNFHAHGFIKHAIRLTLALTASLALLLLTGTVTRAQTPPSSFFADPILISRDMDGAHAVVAADLDRDGDQDVAAVSRLDGQVRWFRNGGGAPPVMESIFIDTLDGVYSIYPADLNGDGAIDLAAVGVGHVEPSVVAADARGRTLGELVWYESDGAATPTFTRRLVDETLNYPVAVFAIDLDIDGDVDLLSSSRDDSRTMWFENNGAAQPGFTPHLLTDQFDGNVSVHAGDLNHDGRPDVVFAAENTDTIGWFENQGGAPAQFTLHVLRTLSTPLPPSVDYAKAVLVTDIDSDGDNDIAFASENQNTVGWYENDGAASPQFTLRVAATDVNHAKFVHARDIDYDGDMDLLSASTVDQTIALFENDGSQPPQFVRRNLTIQANGARGVTVTDLNGDGRLDVLSASRDDDRVQWMPNLSLARRAHFAADAWQPLARGAVSRPLTGDLNRDGAQDVVTVFDDRLVWFKNDGAAPATLAAVTIHGDAVGVTATALTDLDRDGDADLLAVGGGDATVSWYEQRSSVPPLWVLHPIVIQAGTANDAQSADLDGDGDGDVVAALSDGVRWLRQTPGMPVQWTPQPSISDQHLDRLLLTDLDRDGDVDIVGTCLGCSAVLIFLNDGAPTPSFSAPQRIAVTGAQAVVAADLDRDGHQDLVVGGRNGVIWLHNDGGGAPTFSATPLYMTDGQVADLRVVDIDYDGDPDVFVAVPATDALLWYEHAGTAPPTFIAHTALPGAVGINTLTMSDLNGDGDLDLVGASPGDGVLAWVANTSGHYAATATAAPAAAVVPGRPDDLVTLHVEHQGRPGAADLLLHSVDVRLLSADGAPLAADALRAVESLALYRDRCCDSSFQPDVDILLAQVTRPQPNAAGRISLALPADQAATLYHGQRATFFVVAQLTGACRARPAPFTTEIALSGTSVADSRNGAWAKAGGMAAGPFATLTVDDPYSVPRPRLSEIAAVNATWEDPDMSGQYPSWFELHNDANVAAPLGGFYLTTDPAKPTMFRIPDEVVVPPHGFVTVVADGASGASGAGLIRSTLALNPGGGFLGLYAADGAQNRPLDTVHYGPQAAGEVYARYPTGGTRWQTLAMATPGAVNRSMDESTLTSVLFLPAIRLGVTYVDACAD